jgi:hypothetical protein
LRRLSIRERLRALRTPPALLPSGESTNLAGASIELGPLGISATHSVAA